MDSHSEINNFDIILEELIEEKKSSKKAKKKSWSVTYMFGHAKNTESFPSKAALKMRIKQLKAMGHKVTGSTKG